MFGKRKQQLFLVVPKALEAAKDLIMKSQVVIIHLSKIRHESSA